MTAVALLLLWTSLVPAQSPAMIVPAKFDAEGLGQFLVPVLVREHTFWCSLDSGGSWVFAVHTEKARAAGLEPNSSGTSAGAGPEVIRDQRVRGITASIGTLTLPDLTIVLRPGPAIVPDMDCVFGLGLLQDQIVQFDYTKPELRIYSPAAFRPPSDAVAIPFEIDRFRNPQITTQLVIAGHDAIDATLMLDTGASDYHLVLVERFTRANAIHRRAGRVAPEASHTPGLVLSVTRAAQLRVGSFEVPAALTALLETPSAGIIQDGLIGAGFFKHFVATFDYGRRQLWLQQQSPLSVRLPHDASGVAFTHGSNGRYRIDAVLPDTPASAAGLRIGDVLISVDGRDARELTIGQIRDLFRQAGETRHIAVDRDAAVHIVHLLLKERI
jgi:hypothetical protein